METDDKDERRLHCLRKEGAGGFGRRDGAEGNDNDLPSHTVTTIICWMQVCQTALAVVTQAAGASSFQSQRGSF